MNETGLYLAGNRVAGRRTQRWDGQRTSADNLLARAHAAARKESDMAEKRTAKTSPAEPAAPSSAKPAESSGADDKTRDAFRRALEAKNAKAAERTGEEHLNATGMSLHPNDKQQRTHRRKSI